MGDLYAQQIAGTLGAILNELRKITVALEAIARIQGAQLAEKSSHRR